MEGCEEEKKNPFFSSTSQVIDLKIFQDFAQDKISKVFVKLLLNQHYFIFSYNIFFEEQTKSFQKKQKKTSLKKKKEKSSNICVLCVY